MKKLSIFQTVNHISHWFCSFYLVHWICIDHHIFFVKLFSFIWYCFFFVSTQMMTKHLLFTDSMYSGSYLLDFIDILTFLCIYSATWRFFSLSLFQHNTHNKWCAFVWRCSRARKVKCIIRSKFRIILVFFYIQSMLFAFFEFFYFIFC